MSTGLQTLNSTQPAQAYYFDLLWLQKVCPVPLFWINEERVRARRVFRYRAYYDGDHDAKLTPEMQQLLRIKDTDDGFTLNMMPSVVDTKADRCIVQSINAVEDKTTTLGQPLSDEDKALLKDPTVNPSAWIQDRMETNHFDIIQGETHQAAIRDADSYLMVSFDNDKQRVRWTFEEGFDGSTGMLAYYPSRNVPEMACAIKIWQITLPNLAIAPQYADAIAQWTKEGTMPDTSVAMPIFFRVNVYYPDRIEKYFAAQLSSLQPWKAEGDTTHIHPWVDRQDKPLGIPVIHFRNGGRHNYGISELRNAISPQNALNRFNYSAVMISELTAFSILVARGHKPPSTITPGMIYDVTNSAAMTTDQVADLTRLPAGDLKPILDMIDKERHLIADITRTPSPDLMGGSGGNKTGEYLKQLEIGLLGKVRAFQVRAGASWEAVADMTWKVEAAFGNEQPPAYKRFVTKWKPAELRDKMQVVQAAVMMDPIWGPEQTMKEVSGVFDSLDEETIAQILAARAMQAPMQPGQPNGVQDQVNPGTGKVQISEPPQTIGGQQPNGNQPAIRGSKLQGDAATQVNPISHAEIAAVGAMHRNMVGQPA